MKTLAYYNGAISEIKDAVIPMEDRAAFYADGCYDALYCRHYHFYCLKEHLDRLTRSAAALDIPMPMERRELEELLQSLVRQVDEDTQFVYIQLTRGTGYRAHDYGARNFKTNLWITLTPRDVLNPAVAQKAVLAIDRRFTYCNIKTINLLPNVLAAEKARAAGCNEAILYRAVNPYAAEDTPEERLAGRVTECSHSNVAILKAGEAWVSPTDNLILPGIGRANMIRMCRKFGIPVHEEPFTVRELLDADEIVRTASGCFCAPFREIDGQPVGGKAPKLLKKLQSALMQEWLEMTE